MYMLVDEGYAAKGTAPCSVVSFSQGGNHFYMFIDWTVGVSLIHSCASLIR